MHFKSVALLLSLVFPAVVLSAPIANGPQDAPVQLYARVVGVIVEPDPTGDFQNLINRPPRPVTPPPDCTKTETKEWKKAARKCRTLDQMETEFTKYAIPRVTAAIHAAESVLNAGAGPIHALVKNGLHDHAEHDDLPHWTFSFSAPGCGAGRCVGHAYEAGAPRQARIFSAAHATIFNA